MQLQGDIVKRDISTSSTTTSVGGAECDRAHALGVYVKVLQEQILVPIPRDSNVSDLHTAALSRAEAIGFISRGTWTIANSVLRTTGRHAAAVFAGDLVEDLMRLTEDETFTLGLLQTMSLESSIPPTESGLVSNTGVAHEKASTHSTTSTPISPVVSQEAIRDSDFESFFPQPLDPVLPRRETSRRWHADARPTQPRSASTSEPDESIVVCIDKSGSMENRMPAHWAAHDSRGAAPTRMAEVKEFFKQLSTRIATCPRRVHTGLVSFGTDAHLVQPLSDNQAEFRAKLDGVQSAGSTAMWDALGLATEMLMEQRRLHPKARRRIIILTDGENNAGRLDVEAMSRQLFDLDVIVDAIVIGTNVTQDLFKVSRQTGGYAFKPKNQRAFFDIALLETMVIIETRPDIVKVNSQDWASFEPKAPDMVDQFDLPPCRPHPNQHDDFVALDDSIRGHKTEETHEVTTAASAQTRGVMSGDVVLLDEVNAMSRHRQPHIDVFVSTRNMRFWTIVMQGPPDSPYKHGSFALYLEIISEFPRRPPSVRFITPVLHPNISKHGRICHPILDRGWNPGTRIYQVLQRIYDMLSIFEARDAIDPISTLMIYTTPVTQHQLIQEHVARFASRSRAALGRNILGDKTANESLTARPPSSSTIASVDPALSTTTKPPSRFKRFYSKGSLKAKSSAGEAAQRRPEFE